MVVADRRHLPRAERPTCTISYISRDREFSCPLAQRAFLALRRWAKLDPIRFATEPAADLVRQELGDDVDYLIADRPALRQAQAALRTAAAEIGRVQDEPLVQFAAAELEAEQHRP